MRLDPQLLVKDCISSPVSDYKDSSRIHILLLFDSKTILNKMQVYLFSFLFVLSSCHTLFCHYSLHPLPLFITSLQFFQDLSNIFIHADRLSPYFFRCICFTLVQTHIKCMRKCVCHLPERIFYNTRRIMFIAHHFLEAACHYLILFFRQLIPGGATSTELFDLTVIHHCFQNTASCGLADIQQRLSFFTGNDLMFR